MQIIKRSWSKLVHAGHVTSSLFLPLPDCSFLPMLCSRKTVLLVRTCTDIMVGIIRAWFRRLWKSLVSSRDSLITSRFRRLRFLLLVCRLPDVYWTLKKTAAETSVMVHRALRPVCGQDSSCSCTLMTHTQRVSLHLAALMAAHCVVHPGTPRYPHHPSPRTRALRPPTHTPPSHMPCQLPKRDLLRVFSSLTSNLALSWLLYDLHAIWFCTSRWC